MPFAMTDIAGSLLGLDASALTGLSDSDPVATFTDQSGNGRDATQSTGSLKPTYKTNIQLGKPVVRFDGVDDVLATPSLTVGTAYSFVAVCSRPWTLAAYAALFGMDYAFTTGKSFLNAGGTTQDWQSNDALLFGSGFGNSEKPRAIGPYGSLTDNTFHVLSGILGASTAGIWLDGTLISTRVSSVLAVPNSTAPLYVGNNLASGGNTWDRDIAELWLYDNDIGSVNRLAAESFLTAKWITPPPPPPAVTPTTGRRRGRQVFVEASQRARVQVGLVRLTVRAYNPRAFGSALAQAALVTIPLRARPATAEGGSLATLSLARVPFHARLGEARGAARVHVGCSRPVDPYAHVRWREEDMLLHGTWGQT